VGLQVANFLVGLTFLHLLNTLGTSVLYSIFTMVCFSATLFVKQNVVETKGRTLEEIENMLLPLTTMGMNFGLSYPQPGITCTCRVL
jgi:hypothetical protein